MPTRCDVCALPRVCVVGTSAGIASAREPLSRWRRLHGARRGRRQRGTFQNQSRARQSCLGNSEGILGRFGSCLGTFPFERSGSTHGIPPSSSRWYFSSPNPPPILPPTPTSSPTPSYPLLTLHCTRSHPLFPPRTRRPSHPTLPLPCCPGGKREWGGCAAAERRRPCPLNAARRGGV